MRIERHDSTVAESVAVKSRKQNDLPDSADRALGHIGPAGFAEGVGG